MSKTVKVFAPASVGNMSVGFDVLGCALNEPGDVIEMKLTDGDEVKIVEITGDNGKLPKELLKNTAGIAVAKMLEHLQLTPGIDIILHKKMPIGSGLGSSAASAAAAVYALNKILSEPLTTAQLVPFAMEGEKMASGAAHADNVAPSLLGGIILIRNYEPLDVISLPVPINLHITVVHPDVVISTKEARAILPETFERVNYIKQSAALAAFVQALHTNDYDLLSESTVDFLAEPYRKSLIMGYDNCKQASMNVGALSFGISGSGPSVFSLSPSLQIAQQVGQAISDSFAHLNINSEIYAGKINQNGPKLIVE